MDWEGRSLHLCEETIIDDCDEATDATCSCDKPGLLRGVPWADADDDAVCVSCASTWRSMAGSTRSSIELTAQKENGEMSPEMRPGHREPKPVTRAKENTDHTVGLSVGSRAHSSIFNKSQWGSFE